MVPLRLLFAAQIELIAHDKTPNLFVRLAVGNFKTDLQRINAKERFGGNVKNESTIQRPGLSSKLIFDITRDPFSFEKHVTEQSEFSGPRKA